MGFSMKSLGCPGGESLRDFASQQTGRDGANAARDGVRAARNKANPKIWHAKWNELETPNSNTKAANVGVHGKKKVA